MNKNATFVKQNTSRNEKSLNSKSGSCIPCSSVGRLFVGRKIEEVLKKIKGIKQKPIVVSKFKWYKNPIKWYKDRKYIKVLNTLLEKELHEKFWDEIYQAQRDVMIYGYAKVEDCRGWVMSQGE